MTLNYLSMIFLKTVVILMLWHISMVSYAKTSQNNVLTYENTATSRQHAFSNSELFSHPLNKGLAELLPTNFYKSIKPTKTIESAKAVETVQTVDTVKENLTPLSALNANQKKLKRHLTSIYYITEDLAHVIVDNVFSVGKKYKIDPILLLAIIKVESTFNPKAVSRVNAAGLMQVLPKAHPEKIAEIGGVNQLFVPEVNIRVGTRILRDYLKKSNGSLENALQFYNGAFFDKTRKYARKVLAAKRDIEVAQSSS